MEHLRPVLPVAAGAGAGAGRRVVHSLVYLINLKAYIRYIHVIYTVKSDICSAG